MSSKRGDIYGIHPSLNFNTKEQHHESIQTAEDPINYTWIESSVGVSTVDEILALTQPLEVGALINRSSGVTQQVHTQAKRRDKLVPTSTLLDISLMIRPIQIALRYIHGVCMFIWYTSFCVYVV